MNDLNFEKLSALKDEHLSKDERDFLRERIHSFMETHPISVTPSPYSASFRRLRKPIAISSVLVLFGLSAGLSYASETAVPGDVLYPIKIHVNEAVLATVARTPTAKASFAQKRIERRVKESEVLAKRGNVATGTKETLQMESTLAMEEFMVAQNVLMREGKVKEAKKQTDDVDRTLDEHRDALSKLEVKAFRSHKKGERAVNPYEKEEVGAQTHSSSTPPQKVRAVRGRSENPSRVNSSGTSTQMDAERPRTQEPSGEKEDRGRRTRENHGEHEENHNEDESDD